MLNNAAMTSATMGTGTTIALGSAVDVPATIRGFDTFANAGATNGMIVGYRIQDGVAWEIGTAVYSAAEPQLTSRTVIRSSDGTSAINLSGNQQIFIVPLNGGGGGIGLVTLDGIQTLENKSIQSYGEPVNIIGSIGGGTQDIDLRLGNVVTATVDTSETTFTFSHPKDSGTASSFTLILTNGGSQTVNWPATVRWTGGEEPLLTTSGQDVITFMTVDAGTNWYGFVAGLDMSVPT